MLLSASKKVYSILSSDLTVINQLDNGSAGIKPLLAEVEDGKAFITYAVKYNGNVTKGGKGDLLVMVQSWAETYNKSLKIADAVAGAFFSSGEFSTYQEAETLVNHQNIIYTQQIFNLKF